MGYTLLIVCAVVLDHIVDNDYLCAANIKTVHQMHGKAVHDSDILLDTSVHTRRDHSSGKSEINPGADIIDVMLLNMVNESVWMLSGRSFN